MVHTQRFKKNDPLTLTKSKQKMASLALFLFCKKERFAPKILEQKKEH